MALLTGFNQIQANTQTFSDWLNKTNEMILMFRGDTVGAQTAVMTANGLPGGSLTYGNATLFGQFAANAVVVFNEGLAPSVNAYANGSFGGLRGGNYDFGANDFVTDTLYITSNTTHTDEAVEVYVNTTYGLIVEQNIEARHDVLFVGTGGSNTDPKLHWEDVTNTLNFNYLVKETFGDLDEAEMFYDNATTKFYSNTNQHDIRATANLNLITDVLEARSESNNEIFLTANVNNGVELYWNNIKKISTNTHGIEVYGQVIADNGFVTYNNQPIQMGGDVYANTHNFEVITDGIDSFITETSNDLYLRVQDNLIIQDDTGLVNLFVANTSGEVTLYHNNVSKLQTNTAGIEVFGLSNTVTFKSQSDATFDGSAGLDSNSVSWTASTNTWNYRDNISVTFGDSADLTIVHNANNTLITENSNGNLIVEATDLTLRATDGSRYLQGDDGVATRIYSPESDTVELTANNIGVHIENAANTDTLRVRSTSYVEGNFHFGSEAAGAAAANLVYDQVTNTLNFNDEAKATFGTSNEFAIYHNTVGGTILEHSTAQPLFVKADDILLESFDGTDDYLRAVKDGAVTLYHNNAAKIATKADGVTVTGIVYSDGLDMGSNEAINLGDANTFTIVTDGIDSRITETGAGNLLLQANGIVLEDTLGTNYLTATANAGVDITYAGNVKLQTAADGVDVTGTLDVSTNLTVQGVTNLNGNIFLGDTTADLVSLLGRFNTDLDPSSNVAYDLGDSLLRWNNGWFGGSLVTDLLIAEANAIFETNIQVNNNATVSNNVIVTNDVSAATFTGDGSALTALNASQLTTGTVNDARLPDTITSSITGTAAQANDVYLTTDVTDNNWQVPFFDKNTAAPGYHTGFTDTTFYYNPLNKELVVDNLLVTTGATLPAGVAFSNTTTFENINVTGTANLNISTVTSLEANGVAFTGTGGDVASAAATTIDAFDIGQTKGFKYFVHGENLNDPASGYAVEINVIVSDDGQIFYTRYGEVDNSMPGVALTPVVNTVPTPDTIELVATCTSANANNIHRFKVLKIETRPL